MNNPNGQHIFWHKSDKYKGFPKPGLEPGTSCVAAHQVSSEPRVLGELCRVYSIYPGSMTSSKKARPMRVEIVSAVKLVRLGSVKVIMEFYT